MKFSAIVDVRRAWAAAGIAEREGVTDADIRAFENRYGVRLPNDLAQYFKTVDGMNDGEYDDHPIHFWPLSKVRPVTAELSGADPVPYAGLFVFADYSLWARVRHSTCRCKGQRCRDCRGSSADLDRQLLRRVSASLRSATGVLIW